MVKRGGERADMADLTIRNVPQDVMEALRRTADEWKQSVPTIAREWLRVGWSQHMAAERARAISANVAGGTSNPDVRGQNPQAGLNAAMEQPVPLDAPKIPSPKQAKAAEAVRRVNTTPEQDEIDGKFPEPEAGNWK